MVKHEVFLGNLFSYFKQSFDNKIMSRSESKALSENFKSFKFNKKNVSMLRAKIFDLALSKMSKLEDKKIVEWLEESVKLIIKNIPKSEANHEAYFSPGLDCQQNIIKQIRKAQKDIKLCIFTISDDEIFKELILKHEKGIKITLISDNDKMDDMGSDVQKLIDAGIETYVDRTSNHMHHKFAIFDEKFLLTGSYNWTRSAYKYNHENIVIQEDTYLVSRFVEEFEKMLNEMNRLK